MSCYVVQCNVIKCNTLHCNEDRTGVLFTLYMNSKLERQHTMAPLAALMGPFASYLFEMYI